MCSTADSTNKNTLSGTMRRGELDPINATDGSLCGITQRKLRRPVASLVTDLSSSKQSPVPASVYDGLARDSRKTPSLSKTGAQCRNAWLAVPNVATGTSRSAQQAIISVGI